ncbi:hypothetical protein AX774_g7869 [Zancudomyces culisetae]|uniref:Uncharacterized protein n=1 Tax=Zancudomyces culisetae TaxID=1213189 RepID=A0A1R1PCT2_ZANCU|nr:hypothetical protein AX774_g7869 [Zancudomyces culisetae]|eukprot:OMH78729.1 hypothetical protein AX774_g7869 [Zancudomyces culisetae]
MDNIDLEEIKELEHYFRTENRGKNINPVATRSDISNSTNGRVAHRLEKTNSKYQHQKILELDSINQQSLILKKLSAIGVKKKPVTEEGIEKRLCEIEKAGDECGQKCKV